MRTGYNEVVHGGREKLMVVKVTVVYERQSGAGVLILLLRLRPMPKDMLPSLLEVLLYWL